MSDPWADFRQSAPAPSADQWGEFRPAEKKTRKGVLWPVSIDEEGNRSFDSDAGILGAAKRALTLPAEVLTGKVQMWDEEGHIAPEAIGRTLEMAGAVAPANPAIRAGDRAVPGALKALAPERVGPPTAQALHEAADAGYNSVRGMDVRYAGPSVNAMAKGVADDLLQKGFIAENAPITNSVVRSLQDWPEGAFGTPGTLDIARQALNKIQPGTPDHTAAQRAIRGIDEFIMGDHAPGSVAGAAADAGQALTQARGNYAAAKRSDRLTGIEDAAGLRSSAANSGHNLDNSIRSRIASLLLNEKQSRGFTDAEEVVLREIVEGTPVRNRVRDVGNLLGGGGGLGAVVAGTAGAGAGLATGSPALAAAGALAPAVGYGAKAVANALTKRSLGRVDKQTRARSPLFEQMQSEAPMTAITPEGRAAVIRALMMSAQGQN